MIIWLDCNQEKPTLYDNGYNRNFGGKRERDLKVFFKKILGQTYKNAVFVDEK